MDSVVGCISDTHAYITELQSLWSNLEKEIDPSLFQSALIIFLGDYCGRGPCTRQVIDFLIQLPSIYPNQKYVSLSGNHDLAFTVFLGLLPLTPGKSSRLVRIGKDCIQVMVEHFNNLTCTGTAVGTELKSNGGAFQSLPQRRKVFS